MRMVRVPSTFSRFPVRQTVMAIDAQLSPALVFILTIAALLGGDWQLNIKLRSGSIVVQTILEAFSSRMISIAGYREAPTTF